MTDPEQFTPGSTGRRRLQRADGSPRPVGLIGNPVRHSLSPFFQDAAFSYHSLPQRYEKWEIAPEEFNSFLDYASLNDFLGLNVTLPYKQAAWAAAVKRSEAAEFTGAVNTLLLDDSTGLWSGHNTDIAGFLAAGLEAGFNPAGSNVLLVGAGGAARAVVYALGQAGAAEIAVANRTAARAEQLVREFSPLFPTTHLLAVPLEPSAWTFNAVPRHLVVNASSQALLAPGEPFPCTPEAMAGPDSDHNTLFYDLVYGDTPFLRAARHSNFPVLDGLPMLVNQGALSFELWTGLAAPRSEMLAAARAALAARHQPGNSK